MTALVVYASYNGTTEKIAYKIKEDLECHSVIINASFNEVDSWRYYDKVIICFSVHLEMPHKDIIKFIKTHLDELVTKEVYIVVSCVDDKWLDQKFAKSVPDQLLPAIKGKQFVGGILKKSVLSHTDVRAVEKMEKKLGTAFDNVNTVDENLVISLAKSVTKE